MLWLSAETSWRGGISPFRPSVFLKRITGLFPLLRAAPPVVPAGKGTVKKFLRKKALMPSEKGSDETDTHFLREGGGKNAGTEEEAQSHSPGLKNLRTGARI